MHPCLYGAEPINGTGVLVMQVATDKNLLGEIKKAEAEDAKKRVVKPKDPNNTEKARNELDAEGKSIISEKNSNMNDDKVSGTGTLKVRFEVTSPNARSFQDKKNNTLQSSPGKESLVKSARQ